ncbi:MAG: NDP-hexose 4-ketoreductase, partial [Actinobacteria bacterium]|nr:NDP-hexose 4-ketoreductase [Actinomycetota bacterium]
MFERFTSHARHVVVLAQEEARRMHHNYIGTEHVLLGLLGEPDGAAGRALRGVGLSLDGGRQEVLAIVGTGKRTPTGHIPFTPRAKKTLELSLREALQLHHNYIGTEHILLGLIREGEGVAAQIMRQHADLLAIRMAVLDLVP